MITPIQTPWEPDVWRRELRHAIRNAGELLDFVDVKRADGLTGPDFPTLVPRGFAARMERGNAHDPLLRQVLAVSAEQIEAPGFVADPLMETAAELGFSSAPGLIHKYRGRALLIVTAGCAVHCRYCFRRAFPYPEHRSRHLAEALAAVTADTYIEELILSGGDPLLLDDAALGSLLAALADIPHLRRLRIHTRVPVVLPQRVTTALTTMLAESRLPMVVVIHANHGNELDAMTARALGNLQATGAWLLNQAVLLRGVNDSAEAQIRLAKALFSQDVQPYYLHMPDRVAGTTHFFIDDVEARRVYRGMQAELPGYLLPKLVREVPGEAAKRIVSR